MEQEDNKFSYKKFCHSSSCSKVCLHFLLSFLIVAVTVYVVIQSIDTLAKDDVGENQVTISAQGTVTAVPDIAEVYLSVFAQGKAPKEVQDKVSESMNKISDFVKNEGVDSKDIKTLNLSLNPTYYYPYSYPQIPCPLASEVYPPSDKPISCPPSSPVIIGYEANQTLLVKVRDLDKVGKIIDGAVENGATQVSGVNFSIDDPDKYKADAREKAFNKAREKANELAKIAGMKIRKVVNFSESGDYVPIMRSMEVYGFGGGMSDGAKTSVEAGSQDVTVTMSVTFEIK
jgi:uncharacterized protein